MLAVIVSLLLRSGLILGAAEVLRRLATRSPAASRHRIVLAGLALLLLWPFTAAIIPEVAIPLVSSGAGKVDVTIRQTYFAVGRSTASVWMPDLPVLVWAVGVVLALFPFLFGYFRVWLAVRQARTFEEPLWRTVLRAECERLGVAQPPKLLILRGHKAPFTFGVTRPKIVLPADSESWTSMRVRAVLLHELAHVQRRDLAWQALTQIVCALWWFQPLCWWSRWTLRRESERACDAVVLDAGMRASDYAQELLAIAQRFSTRWSASYAALSMARRGDLEGRLYAILDPHGVCERRFPWAAVAGMAALTVTASAVTLIPEESKPTGGHMMKRTILSGLLASAGLSAATISGSVFDPTGSAVAKAQAQLYNPDTAMKQEATTAADGKFVFESLPAGSYILRVNKPGFDPLYRVFNVSEDANVKRGLMLETRARNPVDPADPKLIRVGGEAAEANLVTKIQPVYPPDAKASRLQGTVEMDVIISKEGVPVDIRVLRSPGEELTSSALEAVRQWRYKPTLLNGEPVEILTNVVINYTLSN